MRTHRAFCGLRKPEGLHFSLADRKALALGISNDQPIAYGCANAFRKRGVEIAVTYLNDRAKAFVLPSPDVTKSPPVRRARLCPPPFHRLLPRDVLIAAREKEGFKPVLVFDYQMLVNERELDRPVNYALVHIVVPDSCPF